MSWVDVSRSSTYKALERAKKRGLVVEHIEKQSDKPFRSVFCVTIQGREAFFESLRLLWREPPKVCFEEHIGVFFLNLLPEEEAAELLEGRLDSLREWVSDQADSSEAYPLNVMKFSTLDFIKKRLNKFAKQEIDMYNELADALRGQAGHNIDEFTPAFSGSLKEFDLVNIIKLLVDGRRTGTLCLTRNLVENALHFKEGHVMGCSSNAPQADTLAEIYAAFSISDGRFTFESSVRDKYLPIKLTTMEFLREGCRGINEWEKIRGLVPSESVVFDWVIDRTDAIVNLGVSEEETEVLKRVNGMRSVQDIVRLTDLSLFRVCKSLYVYSHVGAIATVSSDKRELVQLLKGIVKLLLEGAAAILTKREMGRLAAAITELARKQGAPLEIDNGIVFESFSERVDISELERTIKSFLTGLIDLLKGKVGEAVVDDLLDVYKEQLAPEAGELMFRYGLI